MLLFFTADGSKISIRPSGTEPKIKFYMEVRGEMANRSDYHDAEKIALEKIANLRKDLGI